MVKNVAVQTKASWILQEGARNDLEKLTVTNYYKIDSGPDEETYRYGVSFIHAVDLLLPVSYHISPCTTLQCYSLSI